MHLIENKSMDAMTKNALDGERRDLKFKKAQKEKLKKTIETTQRTSEWES